MILRTKQVFALWDGFPVTEGHALVVPHRHVPSWFDATHDERAELFCAIDAVRDAIQQRWPVDAFNIGINVGAAAGQTVPHLHLHVIPRRDGDVADPRGGVRYVIPEKANYLARMQSATATVPRGWRSMRHTPDEREWDSDDARDLSARSKGIPMV